MESRTLVICDEEIEFAEKLAHFIETSGKAALLIQVCSELSYVCSLQEEMDVDILLIADSFLQGERGGLDNLRARQLIWLTSEKDMADGIFKYQPADAILDQLINQCLPEGSAVKLPWKSKQKEKGRVIGIFSPVHRIGKTTYALDLGKKLAVSRNVLYINMETFGGVGGYFDKQEQTLSDLLYYVRQEEGDIRELLAEMVGHLEYLDYVNPVRVSEDLKHVTIEEWEELFSRILAESIYEILILDIGDGMQELLGVLDLCQEIHLPFIKEPAAASKTRQFEEELKLLKREDIIRRISKVEMT